MKVKLFIDPVLKEPSVTIEAPSKTPVISDLLTYLQEVKEDKHRLTVKKDGQAYLLKTTDIYTVYLENRVLQVRTKDNCYQSSLRLYQVKERLPSHFLQISQSEIINIHHLDHLQVTANGSVKMVFKNKDVTYSSRRYLNRIKEALQ